MTVQSDNEVAVRFGAIEWARGGLWLGAPHTSGTDWGVQLTSDGLTYWSSLGRAHRHPWDAISRLSVIVTPGEGRHRRRALAGVVNTLTGSLLFDESPDGQVSIEGVLGSPWERFAARGLPNWRPPLTATERHAAERLPDVLRRRPGRRAVTYDSAHAVRLLERLRTCSSLDEVDAVLTN